MGIRRRCWGGGGWGRGVAVSLNRYNDGRGEAGGVGGGGVICRY